MECPNPKFTVVCALMTLLALAMAAGPRVALKLEPSGTSSHIPPLLDCAPSPATPSSSSNLSAFRANVLSLLGTLPVSAASTPTGFAAAQSGGAFARAFCFGFGARGGPSRDESLECLSAAGQDVAGGCHGRRGAVWRGGCFLSYADTNTPTAREDAWRGWFYDGYSDDTPTTAALGSQCAGNITTAECSRCLNESAEVVPALKEGRRKLSLLHGEDEAVVVVGYSCYLRVPLFPLMPRWQTYATLGVFDMVVLMVIEIVWLVFLIRIAPQFYPAA